MLRQLTLLAALSGCGAPPEEEGGDGGALTLEELEVCEETSVDGVVSGRPAPPLRLPAVEGGAPWTFGAPRAAGLPPAEGYLVAFVASWCGICATALPTLRELEVANPTLEIVFVTTDTTPAAQQAELRRVREAGLTGPVLVADAATREVWLGAGSVPRYIFIDRTRRIRSQDRGFGEEVKQKMPEQARRVIGGAPAGAPL
jgi:thiol-disulfide isomerase/thioredoxin